MKYQINRTAREFKRRIGFSLCVIGVLVTFISGPLDVSAQQRESDSSGLRIIALHQAVIDGWLAKHPQWRLASVNDFAREDLADARKWHGKDHNPFYASCDLNSDSYADFAAIVVRKQRKGYGLVVFDGPFKTSRTPSPTFFTSRLQSGDMLVKNDDQPEGCIEVGPMMSDNILILIPQGKTYRLEIP